MRTLAYVLITLALFNFHSHDYIRETAGQCTTCRFHLYCYSSEVQNNLCVCVCVLSYVVTVLWGRNDGGRSSHSVDKFRWHNRRPAACWLRCRRTAYTSTSGKLIDTVLNISRMKVWKNNLYWCVCVCKYLPVCMCMHVCVCVCSREKIWIPNTTVHYSTCRR